MSDSQNEYLIQNTQIDFNFVSIGAKTPSVHELKPENKQFSLLERNYKKIQTSSHFNRTQLRDLLHIIDDKAYFLRHYRKKVDILFYDWKTEEMFSSEQLKYDISSFSSTMGYFSFVTKQNQVFIFSSKEKNLIFTQKFQCISNQITLTWCLNRLYAIIPLNDENVYFYIIKENDVKLIHHLKTLSPVNMASASQDGRYFALADDFGELKILESDTFKVYHTFKPSTKEVLFDCCSFNRDSTMVAVAGSSHLFVFDLIKKTILYTDIIDRCHICKFSPASGNILAALGDKELVLLYFDKEFTHIQNFTEYSFLNLSCGLSFSNDGSKLYTNSNQVMYEFQMNMKFTNNVLNFHQYLKKNLQKDIKFTFL